MKKLLIILLTVLITCLIFVGCTDTKTETDITVSVIGNDTITLNIRDLESTDFTKYFIIFEGTQKVEVLDSYIDKSNLPALGGKGKVVLTYKGKSATLNVTVVEDVIVVSKNQDTITLNTKQINTFDFTTLFKITINGEDIEVLESYIDKSDLPILPGRGSVSMTYEGQTVTVDVTLVQAEKEILVTSDVPSLTLSDEEFLDYNFRNHFNITNDGNYVTVMNSYISISDIVDWKATVTCTYHDVSATIEVNIQKTVYVLTLEHNSIEVNQAVATTFDYLSLFTATRNGEPYELTLDMVTTDVSDALGSYVFTVTIGTTDMNRVSKTLNIDVVFAHQFIVVRCYNGVTIPENELDVFDFTALFALYVDGKAVEVTEDMIDKSALSGAVVGDVCEIALSFDLDDDSVRETITVMIVDRIDIMIIGESRSVDLHSTALDLTKLFTIKRGEETIPVTLSMISGEVDYQVAGTYVITCTYGDVSGTAIITVTDGVIISNRYGDKIYILKGTNHNVYSFANDFKVTINGLTFTNLDSCIDYSNVDFGAVGEYDVTLTIKYNTKKLGLTSVSFDVFTSTITYVVIDTVYTITKPEEVIILPEGTTSFDILSQITVEINNRKQALTLDPDAVSVIACFVEILSGEIDFTSPAHQKIEIAVYVYGPNNEPVIVSYYVCIKSDIEIKTVDKIVFEGDTLFTTELFIITENGKVVDIDYSMLNGKVNTFVPGVYTVSVEYKGVYAETQVVVCSNDLKGEYFTPMRTIPSEDETDEDDQLVSEGSSAKPIGDLILTENGIVVNGIVATDIKFISNSEMTFVLRSNLYTLHYFDGVIVLDPDNSVKLGFNDYKRPYIYFSKSLWEYKSTLIVNSLGAHILQRTYSGYSIDLFTLTNKETGEERTFGLKIYLVSKTAGDTIYEVTWGEATFASELEQVAGEIGKIEFLGDDYSFTMQSSTVAKINDKENMNKLLAGLTFRGLYEDKITDISINSSGNYSVYINGVLKYSFGTYEMANELKTGGYDPVTNTILLYKYLDTTPDKPCFSIKVTLDFETNTFEVVEKTPLWGLFTMDNKYIFLDGYGNGFVNYNTSSYYIYKIGYQINSGILEVKYLDTNVTFPYGDHATFSIESFNNVLRVQEFYDSIYVGQTFENKYITDGAIIRISNATVGKNKTSTDARAELENNITIITKDGELTGAQKSACFDCKLVKFSTPGFYKFSIIVKVGGREFVADYVVQVLESTYEDSPLVGSYNNTILKSGYSLVLDKWGRITLRTPNTTYESSYRVAGNEYFARFMGMGYDFTVSGAMLHNGLISITSTGTLLLNDYLTYGSFEVSANDQLALRRISVGDANYFYLSNSPSALGNFAEVSVISGTLTSNNSILKVVVNGKEMVVTVKEWNNTTSGLILADAFYGTYRNGDSTMTLNGFGIVRINGLTGTYTINANKTITVTIGDNVSFYDVNVEEKTYSVSSMTVDNSIMHDKVLTATYTFVYNGSVCSATTTLTFGKDGKVIITSSSSDFYESVGSPYSPSFLSIDGANTSFNVSKNKLTVTVGTITFVFQIKDVSRADELVLTETTLNENEAGYFSVGQRFTY